MAGCAPGPVRATPRTTLMRAAPTRARGRGRACDTTTPTCARRASRESGRAIAARNAGMTCARQPDSVTLRFARHAAAPRRPRLGQELRRLHAQRRENPLERLQELRVALQHRGVAEQRRQSRNRNGAAHQAHYCSTCAARPPAQNAFANPACAPIPSRPTCSSRPQRPLTAAAR